MRDNEISAHELEPENFPDSWGGPITARDLLRNCYQWISPKTFQRIYIWIAREQEKRGWTREATLAYYNINQVTANESTNVQKGTA